MVDQLLASVPSVTASRMKISGSGWALTWRDVIDQTVAVVKQRPRANCTLYVGKKKKKNGRLWHGIVVQVSGPEVVLEMLVSAAAAGCKGSRACPRNAPPCGSAGTPGRGDWQSVDPCPCLHAQF